MEQNVLKVFNNMFLHNKYILFFFPFLDGRKVLLFCTQQQSAVVPRWTSKTSHATISILLTYIESIHFVESYWKTAACRLRRGFRIRHSTSILTPKFQFNVIQYFVYLVGKTKE